MGDVINYIVVNLFIIMFYVGFNSMSNCIKKFHVKFDCNFVQSFPYIFVGFNVRVVCESLVKIM